MLILLSALAAVAQTPVAAQPAQADADPIVCRRSKSADVGTHMRPKKTCLRKSEWDFVEKSAKRELQQLQDQHLDPGYSPPPR